MLAGFLLVAFNTNDVLSAVKFAPKPTKTPTPTITFTPTQTPTSTITSTPTLTFTPTLITGVLTCNTVAAGVTCINYGSYLDYNINIVVTGLTGGATASGITIGSYKRSTNGGTMGMMSDFVHSETSVYAQNTVLSLVSIQPFDAAAVNYAAFTSGAGTNVSVTNKTSDWRYIGGTGGWPNYLSVKGNVDWPITGYSIVGHIYLYSNQSFITGTPTFTPTNTPTLTPTNTATSTATNTPTPAPNSAYTNAYRFAEEANSGAYSAIVTGNPTLRTDPNDSRQWSYMRVAVQKIINGNVYYAEIGWLSGSQPESNFTPRVYWAYRDINGDTNFDWGNYPGIGLGYNYMVKQTSSGIWSLYFNDQSTPVTSIGLGWDGADRLFSGGEVPNVYQGMGYSDNNNVQYLDPTGTTWFGACSTYLVNENPSRYFVDAGGNCSSWSVYGNN